MSASRNTVVDERTRAILAVDRAHRKMARDFEKQGKRELGRFFLGISVGARLAAKIRPRPWLNPWWL
jgi:hypothetical protein